MNKKTRQLIFDKYGGSCAYCGCELQKGWHVDHIEPMVRLGGKVDFPENDYLDNYNPSCPSCNINKHSLSLEDFRRSIVNYIDSLNRYSIQYKFAKKFGLVKETGEKVIFYFERLSNGQ